MTEGKWLHYSTRQEPELEYAIKGSTRKLREAEAAIKRVRELHGRHDPNCPYGQDCAGAGLCLACREEYPCATIRALDGLEGRIDD